MNTGGGTSNEYGIGDSDGSFLIGFCSGFIFELLNCGGGTPKPDGGGRVTYGCAGGGMSICAEGGGDDLTNGGGGTA